MEDEDYRIINLHNNTLKVYRDGRIENQYIYKNTKLSKNYKKGDIKWKPLKPRIQNNGYNRVGLWHNNKGKDFLIHRIMGYTFLGLDIEDTHQVIDHIDHNRTNNDWLNLRVVTNQQNHFNISGVKGYRYRSGKYDVRITFNNKEYHLGRYKTEDEARQAYLEAKEKYHKY